MIEVEVKVLLGEKENAIRLRKQLSAPVKTSAQKNHYFVLTSKDTFEKKIKEIVTNKELLNKILTSNDISVRTRDDTQKGASGKRVLLVLKASIDDMTSANGRARLELEEALPLTLDELDTLLLNAGCSYQAKWSREREEFIKDGIAITIDKNAGYGYLAEFELQVEHKEEAEQAKEKIYALLKELGLEELNSERLNRMFEYYNKHWNEYYGTEKTFTVQ